MGFSSLPPEIALLFPLLSLEEQKTIKEENTISNNSSFIECTNFLLSCKSKLSSSSSDIFNFLLGRFLYHSGNYSVLQKEFNTNPTSAVNLWSIYWFINKGDALSYEDLLNQLLLRYKNSVLSCFIHYLMACIYLNQKSHDNFIRELESCYNYPIHMSSLHLEDKSLYRIIMGYVMIIDASHLQLHYNLNKAKDKARETLKLINEINDRILILHLYNLIGTIEIDYGKIEVGHQFLLKSEAMAQKHGENRALVKIKADIGDMYLLLGHIDDATYFYSQSFQLLDTFPDDILLTHLLQANYTDILWRRGKKELAIENLEIALEEMAVRSYRDFALNLKYVEFLLYSERLDEAEKILQAILLQETKILTERNLANLYFLQGYLEYSKRNFGEATVKLETAIHLADDLNLVNLSSKILVLLTILFLHKYEMTDDLEQLIDADKCLEDIITFLEEKGKTAELAEIFLIRAKIKLLLMEIELATTFTSEGEIIARKYNPVYLQKYKHFAEELEAIKETDYAEEKLTNLKAFDKEIINLREIMFRESKKIEISKEDNPLALLLFHHSGIPIRTYLSEDIQIEDDLLFGGFISAIKNILDELFIDDRKGVLTVDHGSYKLLLEFHWKYFTVVVVAFRDSYVLRRKMHRLLEFIASKNYFEGSFKGKLTDSQVKSIDTMVKELFNFHVSGLSEDIDYRT